MLMGEAQEEDMPAPGICHGRTNVIMDLNE
jgi:hypothetical protein